MSFKTGSGGDPLTREDAMLRPEWPKWEKAEIDELESMDRLEVYDWIPRSEVQSLGKKIIKSKWVYKYKEVEMRYKCRLCAKGFMQSPFEYGETYAPVCRLALIRNDPDVVIRADTSTESKGAEPPLTKTTSVAPATTSAQVWKVD